LETAIKSKFSMVVFIYKQNKFNEFYPDGSAVKGIPQEGSPSHAVPPGKLFKNREDLRENDDLFF